MNDLALNSWEEKHPWWRGRWGVLWVVAIFGIGFMILWTGSHEISDLRTERYPLYFRFRTGRFGSTFRMMRSLFL